MATLEDVQALGYNITEYMRIGQAPRFGQPDGRTIIWLVEGHGMYTQVRADDQEVVDHLADPTQAYEYVYQQEADANLRSVRMTLGARGWHTKIVELPGFPDSPDFTAAVLEITDPDGNTEEGANNDRVVQVWDDIQARERQLLEQREVEAAAAEEQSA